MGATKMERRAVSAEQRLKTLEEENVLLKSLLNSFWTGDVPHHATLDHMILAKAGRQRLVEKARVAALLSK